MVVVKQQEDEKAERYGNKDPSDTKVPKVNQPTSRLRRMESGGDWHALYMGLFQIPWDVREPDPEDGGELTRAIS